MIIKKASAPTRTRHNVNRSVQLLEIPKPAMYAKVKRHDIKLKNASSFK